MTEPLRILILEDNPADAELAQFELEEAGFVFTAKVVMTEEDFVQEIHEFCPDIILSDYDLPRYNGALALAEANKTCPDIPFILVTGAVTEDRAIEILTQGAKDYVLKSRLQQRLIPAVKRALDEAKEHRARKQAEAELREAHRNLEERVKIRTVELEAAMAAQKKTEEALRDSEERQRLVLRSSSIGTFEVDLLTGEGRWNATEFELLGLRPGDVKASPEAFFRFVHPDDVERLRNEWQEAMRYGKFDAEFRIVRADGQECWLAGKGAFILDGHPDGDGTRISGKPRRFMGVNFDITGRKKAEEAAAAAHRQVQSIIDNTTAIIYALDLEERFLLANTTLAELLNSTPEQMSGKRRHEFMPKNDADWHEANDRQVIEAGKALEFEEYSQLMGRSITWLTTKFPLRDAQGRIYGVAGISTDVSERKLAEEKLQASEERYRSVVEKTTAIILRVDPSGVINFANTRALEFFGYTADELIGRHVVGSIIPARESTGRDLAAMVDRIVASPDGFHSNANENICKDGRRVWLEWTNSGIYWADGRLKELLCVGIDATARKQAEEALRESEERYRGLFTTMEEGFILAEVLADEGGRPVDFRYLDVNPAGERFFGRPCEEIVGRTYREIGGTKADAEWIAMLGKVALTGQPARIERYAPVGGHWVDLCAHSPNPGQFAAVFADITGRKQMEETLKESEKKYRELIKYAPIGIYEIDFLSRKFVTVNDSMSLLTGYTKDELLAMNPLDILDNDSKNTFMARVRGMPRGETPDTQVEYKVIAKDGHVIDAVLNVSFKVDEQGRPIGAMVIGQDITKRKQAEETLKQQSDGLEAANKELEGSGRRGK